MALEDIPVFFPCFLLCASRYGYGFGSTKLLNTDPMWIRIHNTSRLGQAATNVGLSKLSLIVKRSVFLCEASFSCPIWFDFQAEFVALWIFMLFDAHLFFQSQHTQFHRQLAEKTR